MHNKTFLWVKTLCFSLLLSCQTNDIQQFNWKKESTGYFITDKLTINQLTNKKSPFIGKNEEYALHNLGKPTETLLLSRGEKFFLYSIQYKPNTSTHSFIRVRFNAIGLIKEVMLIKKTI